MLLWVGAAPAVLLWAQVMPVDPEAAVCIAADILAVRDEDDTARQLEVRRRKSTVPKPVFKAPMVSALEIKV